MIARIALCCFIACNVRRANRVACSPSLGAPNLNLSPEEKRTYGQLFRQADTDNVGVVTGEIAVKFFEKTRLDSRILGEVGRSSISLLYKSLCLLGGVLLIRHPHALPHLLSPG